MAAPSRTSWKGFLKLSLISVPVKAFTANDTSGEMHLNQLHKGCHSRIKYQKVCAEHGEVKSDQIVSGFEHQKDHYVVVEPDELDKLRTKADRAVNIDGFIPETAVDGMYYAGKAHYLLPDGVPGERPYALLHQGMVQNRVVAIAQVVIAGREQLVLLRPHGRLLVMTGLHYPQRVRKAAEFESEVAEIDCKAQELALTNTLIAASTLADFQLDRYQDSYVTKLQKLVALKVAGQEVVQAQDREEPKILNLMDALKKSVAEAQARLAGGVPASGVPTTGPSDAPPAEPTATSESGKKLAPSTGGASAAKKARPRKVEGD